MTHIQPTHSTPSKIFALLITAVLVLGACTLHAQEFRGTITGLITDSSGAVLPNATIIAKGPQQTYTTKSGGSGDFTIPLVQPGTYIVSVEAPGFKKFEMPGVIVDVSSKINLPISLAVGQSTETVSVIAQGAQINTTDASGGSVIDPEQVQELPLNGRQMYSLLSLTPGVKGPPPGQAASELNESNGYSINGQWGNYNQFALNGAPVSQQNGGGSGTWNISPSVDAVEEFKVMTNTYDAQYGRTNGGTVNTILKSGTTSYHGTAYDFWRNADLDANSYALNQAGASRPGHNQHQFGGTFGGPIPGLRRNTYFFFSFEGWREVVPSAITTNTITADMLPGSDGSVNLTGYLQGTGGTAIYDPTTTHCATPGQNPCETYTRDPFPNNTIPANRISPAGLSLLKLLPLANRPGYRNNYTVNAGGRNNYNQPIVRVDHDFSPATRVYGMFAWWSGNQLTNSNGFPGAAGGGNGTNYNFYQSSLTQVLDGTHTFRPSLFLDVRLSYNRMYNLAADGAEAAGVTDVTASDIGLQMPQLPTTTHHWLPEIHTDDGALPNYIGNQVSPTIFETYDAVPSMTHVIGPTTLHYGGEISWYHDVANGIRQANGGFNFGPAFTAQNPKVVNNDGSTIADMLLGYPSNGGVEYNDPTYESYKAYAAFIQDDWKVNQHLALNLGVRYENETSPRDRWGRLQAGLCLTCTNPISSTIPGVTLPNGTSFASPVIGGLEFQKNRSPYENTWGILLPKVGVSYALTPNLVVRGGWGLFRALGFELGGTSTWDTTTSYITSYDDGLTPNSAFFTANPFPSGYSTPPGDSQGLASGDGDGIWEDSWFRKIPYTHQFSFGFQGQISKDVVWDLEYVGARTYDLRAGYQRNHLTSAQFFQGQANHAYLDQQIANPFYGNSMIPATSYLGSHPTVPVREMMVPYPQYDSIYGPETWEWNTPWGYSHYDSLIAKAEKRFTGSGMLSNGLSFTASFTWSKLMSATGLLNDGLLVDNGPYYGVDGGDRTFLFSVGGLYKLPIGRGGLLAPDARGLSGILLNDWQMDWIVSNQSGTPVNYPNSYIYTCGNAYDVRPQHKTWSTYLNNSNPGCFTGFPEYTPVTWKPYSIALRNPWAEQTQLALQKEFPMTERARLRFRGEAFNLTNTPIFNGPNTSNPNAAINCTAGMSLNTAGACTGYGTVGPSTVNSPRQVQLSLKVLF